MVKLTQASLAETLFIENKAITHEEFVAQFLRNFPNCPARTAALYWQNSGRRARYGLPKVKLPDVYKDEGESAPKAPKAPKAKKDKAVKLEKLIGDALSAKPKATSSKSLEDLKAVKAKNLAKIKAVGERTSQPKLHWGEFERDLEAEQERAREEREYLRTEFPSLSKTLLKDMI